MTARLCCKVFALVAFLLVKPSFASATDVILDDKLIELTHRTMELAAVLQKRDCSPVPQDAIVYTDEPDAAVFLQEDKYCFGIFRNTTPNIADWLQNLNPFTGIACSTQGECCTTRLGFQEAYYLTNYKDDLESNLRQCKANCDDCEVVLGGHSQGGAIASIAAIVLDDLDPTIIAFGQPGSIIGECSPINEAKYYRFVNTILDGRRVCYDPVPYLNFETDHRGHLFIMGSDAQNVVYYPDGSGPSTFEFRWQVPAHAIAKYITRMSTFRTNAPLQTEGWRLGYACSVDEECVAPRHCVNSQCHEGLAGDPCHNHNDCDSRRCVGFATKMFSGTCRALLPEGQACLYHADCESGTCSWWTCT